jgi:hypothetical protein
MQLQRSVGIAVALPAKPKFMPVSSLAGVQRSLAYNVLSSTNSSANTRKLAEREMHSAPTSASFDSLGKDLQ